MTRASWYCCVIWLCWLFVTHFNSQRHQLEVKSILLLMLFLDSSCSGQDVLRLTPTRCQPKFRLPFWQHSRCLDAEVSVPPDPGAHTLYSLSVSLCPVAFRRLLPQGWIAQTRMAPFPQLMRRLMCFASWLSDGLNHSPIKVYLSVLHSLHIDYGFPDPLVSCLRVQHLLKGIKCVKGPVSPRRLPIKADHLKVIERSLDLSTRDHMMLRAAC